MLASRVKIVSILASVLALCIAFQASAELSCLDEQGKAVDWFIAYKFPQLNGSQLFEDGTAYSYITSSDVTLRDEPAISREVDSESKIFLYRFKDLLLKFLGYRKPKVNKVKARKRINPAAEHTKWIASQLPISHPDSIIMRTLSAPYDTTHEQLDVVFYNDDPTGTSGNVSDGEKLPGTHPNNRRAHAKGVLLMDEESDDGIWMTHSVPRFPFVVSLPLKFPRNGLRNGQTFMCISFNLQKSGAKIVDHLVNMRPLVYYNRISSKMYSMIPNLKNLDPEILIRRRRVPVQPKLTQVITTKAGQVLQLFAKSISFGADMYAGWIDEEIGSDLYVETWRNGAGGPLNSSCPSNDYHINNVKDLKYDSELSWSYLKDHSKWAISEEQDVGVVCIADSNRMASQFKRGGGAVCIKCKTCWSIFSKTILDVEPCPVFKIELQGQATETMKDKAIDSIESQESIDM